MKKKAFATVILVGLGVIVWVVFNPPGQFGWCRFGFTVYGGVPRLISDIQVRSDGAVRKVTKTHDLTMENIEWLLKPQPEILIIAIGWDGVTRPDQGIAAIQNCKVHILKD